MDEIISFAKRKGFVFPSSEIYGGVAGLYDFGPLGVELLNNIKADWWRKNVHEKENYYGLDSAIFKDPRVWEASGHTKSFSDPMAECKTCNTRIRVDKELEKLGVQADEKMSEAELQELFDAHKAKIKCPKCGGSEFTEVKAFNLLVKSNLGDFSGKEENPSYLPGEACQGIYLNFKNVVDSMHPKIPFGIAQIGKAFRNEISPRNFLFRTREFEQADTQLFIRPGENKDYYEKVKEERWRWYTESLQISEENLRWKRHDNLVFYAKDAWDIEYDFPSYGFDEIEGIHDRSDYDLTVHSKASGVDLSYNENGEKFIPWIIETSAGLGRIFLAVLSEFYDIDEMDGKKRTVLRLPYKLAPLKVAVFPLLKNKPELVAKAREVFDMLRYKMPASFDDSGNIGKRYRRQDEIGTPYCVTVDFDSLEDDTVTVRLRDSGEQKRVPLSELLSFIYQGII